MTAEQFDAVRAQPEPKRDRWQRYLLPDPAGGKELPWTRATTFAKSIADTMALSKWSTRMAVKGVAMRQDLYALAAATPIEDKSKLDRIADDAKEAAAASSGANLGTALHSFTEAFDRGEPVNAPDPWAADIDAYRLAMSRSGMTAITDYVERIVVVPTLRVAGTLDRVVRMPSGALAIADLKTGKDLSYSWGEIAIQLALYANAEAMWNGHTGRYDPMPDVDKQRAYVMHLPVGKAACTLYAVDIAAGWEAAQLCSKVRGWRARKDLATQWVPETDPIKRSIAERELTNRIKEAASESDLIALWLEADALGTWGTVHTRAASLRKQELYAHQA